MRVTVTPVSVQRIRNFVLDALSEASAGPAAGDASDSDGCGAVGGVPRSLYIAGVPGTGKTASVMEVVRGLLADVKAERIAPFRFAEVNALRLPSPKHLYARVVEAITGTPPTDAWPLTPIKPLRVRELSWAAHVCGFVRVDGCVCVTGCLCLAPGAVWCARMRVGGTAAPAVLCAVVPRRRGGQMCQGCPWCPPSVVVACMAVGNYGPTAGRQPLGSVRGSANTMHGAVPVRSYG